MSTRKHVKLASALTMAIVLVSTGTPEAQIWRGAATREVVIPAGTILPVRLDSSVGSDISRVEQRVSGHLSRAIVIDGANAIPAGSAVSGVVTDVRRPGKVKGRAHIGLRFSTLTVGDERYSMTTRANGWTGRAAKAKDARNIAIPAGGAAVVGAIVGGKKGAAIGGAAGGGAGTAYVLSTRGPEVRLGRNAAVSVRLTEPLRIRVPNS
jgi:hypothetical protein